jgi:hypothetical protein
MGAGQLRWLPRIQCDALADCSPAWLLPSLWLLIPLDVAHYSGMISPTAPI